MSENGYKERQSNNGPEEDYEEGLSPEQLHPVDVAEALGSDLLNGLSEKQAEALFLESSFDYALDKAPTEQAAAGVDRLAFCRIPRIQSAAGPAQIFLA